MALRVNSELLLVGSLPADSAESALRALWPVYAAQGIERLLLSRVVEDAEQLAIVKRAVPGARMHGASVHQVDHAEHTHG